MKTYVNFVPGGKVQLRTRNKGMRALPSSVVMEPPQKGVSMRGYRGCAMAVGLSMIVLLQVWCEGARGAEPLTASPSMEHSETRNKPAIPNPQPKYEVTQPKQASEASAEPTPSIQPMAKEEVSKPSSARDVWTEPVTRMKMVWVPAGCYSMGCGWWTSDCYVDENPVHEVCVDGFWMGMYEVTQGEWRKVMGSNPSKYKRNDSYPVENISWDDAREFIRKLNAESKANYGFRLPTEVEWEYACRSGGKDEKYSGGSGVDSLAWYGGNSNLSPQTVGTRSPNGLGLYDMSGNVWEWVEDIYSINAYGEHQRDNPINSSVGAHRVYRGGSWYFDTKYARCAFRYHSSPGSGSLDLGFRLVRTR
jgi:formylglycine-generating enzyme required for sulfatase activity